MTKGVSCLDCLWQKIDLALKQEAAYYAGTYNTDDDDCSSDCTDDESDDDDDSCGGDETDLSEAGDEEHAPSLNITLQKRVGETNLFQDVKGRGEVFHNIMKRLDSAEELSKLENIGMTRPRDRSQDDDEDHCESPRDHLQRVLQLIGVAPEVKSYKSLRGFFVQHSPEQIAAYDNTVIGAVRRNDIDELRRLHFDGRDLQCCNQFGESIVHTIARRGSPDMMRFLLKETSCSLRVCCDNGRNPLHDACWTSSPNFEVVRMILRDTPDFLHITDSRNFTPLDYIPRDSWAMWCQFLDDNKELLKPSSSFMSTKIMQ